MTTNVAGIVSPYGEFFPTQPGPAALVTMTNLDTGTQATGIVNVISLALDANHDGTVDPTWNGPDMTSPSAPYVFWANNNYDRWDYDSDDATNYMDDVQSGDSTDPSQNLDPNDADCNYTVNGQREIPDTRDLEDFARLWICGISSNVLPALPLGCTISLNWGDVGNPNPNNPTIDLFPAADPDGGMGYLTNETTATAQINPSQYACMGRIGPGSNLVLNVSDLWSGNYFIWCGVSNGMGGLNLTITGPNSNVLAQATVYIQIQDIKQMYERWTVGENPSVSPAATAQLATNDLPAGVSEPFRYVNQPAVGTPYVLYVHGWNMETWNKDRWAETAFKRLYWQGYQGRFGVFRWPTDYGFTGDWEQFVTDPAEKDNFDSSEYQAWLSGQGLLNKLNDLNTQYPGHVYLLAHSLGNVVVGEALRLAGTNEVVNTYVATQAAVTAHTYDNTLPNSLFASSNPSTPNIYGDWFVGNNGDGAGRVISFYNTNDFALNIGRWGYDEQLKPDEYVEDILDPSVLWTYGYNGSAGDPSPWNNFYKESSDPPLDYYFDIVNVLTNRYEVMGYAAQAYTTALGATSDVHDVAGNRDLTTIWPPDTNPNFVNSPYSEHFYHSAEFRGDYSQLQGYWLGVLGSAGFGLE